MPQSCGLFYSDYHGGLPNATPVVLIHGGFTDHRCWPAQVRRLPNRRVVAVDLPGHGRSEDLRPYCGCLPAQHSAPSG